MKCEVPGREPGIFPLIRHRYDIGDHEVTPITVAPVLPVLGGRRLSKITIKPTLHVEVIKLLAPQHSSEGLTLYTLHVRVGNPPGENIIEAVEAARPLLIGGEPDANRGAALGRDLAHVEPSDLGAFSGRVHRCGPVVNDIFVEGILEMALRSAAAEQSSEIRLVIAEQQAIRVLEAEEKRAERRMPSEDDAIPLILQRWFLRASRPTPDVSEPGLRQDMDGSLFGAAVMDRHPHKDVIHF